MNTKYRVLVVGGTGLVGRKLLELLIKNNFPISDLIVTSRSYKQMEIDNRKIQVVPLTKDVFDGIDICFFTSPSDVSKDYVPYALTKCKWVIDNSSYFRMKEESNLIIPEVNFDQIKSNLISNPNCSTIQSCLVLNEIGKYYSFKKIIYSTYQSCSGGGQKLLSLLDSDLKLRNTCLTNIGEINNDGYSDEEIKLINETRKILSKDIEIHSNCIRVPVSYCHGVFIYVKCDREVDVTFIKNIISKSERLELLSNKEIIYFQDSYGNERVRVGKIKKDIFNKNAFSLFCVADNLMVGAAYNAYLIAVKLIGE